MRMINAHEMKAPTEIINADSFNKRNAFHVLKKLFIH